MPSSLSEKKEEFHRNLYQEHLEEASFLYEQRLFLFEDPEVTWEDIHDFEERFEAHIDGLVVGEELALKVCQTQASEGDFGECHAAVRVFCRQNRQDLVLAVLDELDPEDAECVQAVSDALKHEFCHDWQDDFIRMLTEGDQKHLSILATLFGYRRLPAGKELLSGLGKAASDSLSKVIWALGRLGEQDAREPLSTYLRHEYESIRSESAWALLRLGDQPTIDHCIQAARSQSWASIPLALGGNRSALHVLLAPARSGETDADNLLALGLLGDISAVEPLLTYLSHDELAASAALALQLITGAGLYEDAFIPEVIDEDVSFEDELDAFRQGQAPTGIDGQPFGTTITRLSQNPEDWYPWWAEHSAQFEPRIRYRNGNPYSPACLLENLVSEHSPHKIRQLAYEELVIRYGVHIPFETDMLVVEQKKALSDMADWVRANRNRFQEGTWYFAGQLMSLS